MSFQYKCKFLRSTGPHFVTTPKRQKMNTGQVENAINSIIRAIPFVSRGENLYLKHIVKFCGHP